MVKLAKLGTKNSGIRNLKLYRYAPLGYMTHKGHKLGTQVAARVGALGAEGTDGDVATRLLSRGTVATPTSGSNDKASPALSSSDASPARRRRC